MKTCKGEKEMIRYYFKHIGSFIGLLLFMLLSFGSSNEGEEIESREEAREAAIGTWNGVDEAAGYRYEIEENNRWELYELRSASGWERRSGGTWRIDVITYGDESYYCIVKRHTRARANDEDSYLKFHHSRELHKIQDDPLFTNRYQLEGIYRK